MTAAAPTDNRYTRHPPIPALPADIAKAFKTEPAAWRHFQALAPTYRRHFVAWIHTAKRTDTRERRIRESIAILAAGKKRFEVAAAVTSFASSRRSRRRSEAW